MKNLSFFKIVVIISVITIICMSFGNGWHLFGEANGKYVLVTLKDKSVEKFEYDSFSINWVLPQIKNEVTCQANDFDPGDVEEIYVLNQTWNSCDKRDDWLFDVYLKGKKPIQGFIELSEESVTGKVYHTSEIKSIPLDDILKVSYH